MHDGQKRESFSNWNDLRIFLAVTEAGSFSAAAKRLRTTQPTISRRIENLEESLGVQLFDRVPSGIILTSRGEMLLESAQQIEESLVETRRQMLGSDQRLEGPVRISLTEGLSTFWFSPQLVQFQEAYPAISLELRCSTEPADVLNMESDLSVRFRRPDAPDLIAMRLGTLHAVPWASPEYLERFGMPSAPEDLCEHRLLDHEVYHSHRPNYDAWLALLSATRRQRYWTNSSTSMLSATRNSLGVSLLPTYFCEFTEDILPLDIGLKTSCDCWLTYHPNVAGSARIRAVIDWIKSLFDQEAWPWFRDEFHPPRPSTLAAGTQRGPSGLVAERGLTGRAALTPLPHRDC